MKTRFRLLAPLVALVLALTACGSSDTDDTSDSGSVHTLTDMEGRSVELPQDIDKVVTLGSVPVINGFLFALGEGDVIVNGLPDFALGRSKYQYIFAPAIENQPQTQNADGAPQVEEILKLDPDVVLTMSPEMVEPLESVGLKVVVLQWRDATDVKKVVDLLGEMLDQEERAADYSEYFDATMSNVADTLADVSEADRRLALYMSLSSMTRPHLIADWWISQAGGRSATEGSTEESLPLNVEQIITWNPDVIFVTASDEIDELYGDKRFAQVKAVKNREVYSLPWGAHVWGNRTSEQPLTVYWAANKLYPDKITEEELLAQIKDFYSSIFKADLTDEQVAEIAAGQ